MITDEIMECLYCMLNMMDNKDNRVGVEAAINALGDFDMDAWLDMEQEEKDEFVMNAIQAAK